MGLDVVEFVMEVEDEFRVHIPDEDYADLTTVGRLCDWIVAAVERDRGERLDRHAVFARVRRILYECLNIPETDVSWDSNFVDDLRMD